MPRYCIGCTLRAIGCPTWSWSQRCTFALTAAILSSSASLAEGEARRVWLDGPEPSDSDLVYSLMLDDASGVLAIEVDLLLSGWASGDAEVRTTAMLDGFVLASNVWDEQLLIALAGAEAATGSGAFAEVVIPNPVQPPEVGLTRVLINGGKFSVEYERIAAALGTGDFNGDGNVSFDDFFLFADHFGLTDADPGYDLLYDLDGSGKTDFADFFIFADAFGTRY